MIIIVSFNKYIIIAMLIVIIPYVYMLLGKKPIRNKLQRIWVLLYHIITHFLCFKVIRYIFHLSRFDINDIITYFLCFKMVRHKKKCCWVFAHCLVTYFCTFKLSGTQPSANGFLLIALIHKPSDLKWFGINDKHCGSIYTASSHISCVLRCLGTSLIQRGTFS